MGSELVIPRSIPLLPIKLDEGPKYKMKNILDSKVLHVTKFIILCIGRVIYIWIKHESLLRISLMPKNF